MNRWSQYLKIQVSSMSNLESCNALFLSNPGHCIMRTKSILPTFRDEKEERHEDKWIFWVWTWSSMLAFSCSSIITFHQSTQKHILTGVTGWLVCYPWSGDQHGFFLPNFDNPSKLSVLLHYTELASAILGKNIHVSRWGLWYMLGRLYDYFIN